MVGIKSVVGRSFGEVDVENVECVELIECFEEADEVM
jgi:hypothetical protein